MIYSLDLDKTSRARKSPDQTALNVLRIKRFKIHCEILQNCANDNINGSE